MKTIIADSGSTQCTWLMTDGVQTLHLRTQGINAVLHTPEQVREVLALLPAAGDAKAVYFYGAGCGAQFAEATALLRGELIAHFATERVEVASDLTGAARALFGRGEGIACILGTGSNSCHCRAGEVIANVPPLGYVLGDEGSGSALGRALLNGVFKGHIPLREELLAACSLTYEDIIRRVYREPYANRFLASFAPFIGQHLACEPLREMVVAAFGEFARRNLTHYPKGLPLGFSGGVAAGFEELLRDVMHDYGFEVSAIVASPAEGLLKYHYGE